MNVQHNLKPHGHYITLLLAFLICGLSGYAVAAEWQYTLRPGETLAEVGERCCGDASFGERISKHNHIDQRVTLPVGSRIRIPIEWLQQQPADAIVVSVVAAVTDNNGRVLQAGDSLSMGQSVSTAPGAAMLVRFADGSTLQVGSNAEVGFDLLSAHGDTGMVDTLVRFERGRGVARVRKHQGQNRFRVSTPSGIAAVRGTEFRISAESEQSLVETTEGSVGFDAPTTTLTVDAGYGAIADPTGARVEELLPPPTGLAAPVGPVSKVQLDWDPSPGAKNYWVDVYAVVQGDLQPVLSERVDGTRYRLPPLQPGTYQVNLRAIAVSGLQGLDATTRTELVAPEPSSKPWWLLSLLVLPLFAL